MLRVSQMLHLTRLPVGSVMKITRAEGLLQQNSSPIFWETEKLVSQNVGEERKEKLPKT